MAALARAPPKHSKGPFATFCGSCVSWPVSPGIAKICFVFFLDPPGAGAMLPSSAWDLYKSFLISLVKDKQVSNRTRAGP